MANQKRRKGMAKNTKSHPKKASRKRMGSMESGGRSNDMETRGLEDHS